MQEGCHLLFREGLFQCCGKGGKRTEKDRQCCVQWDRQAAAVEQTYLWFFFFFFFYMNERLETGRKLFQIIWVKRSFLEDRFNYSWSESRWKSTRRQREIDDVLKSWEQVINKCKEEWCWHRIQRTRGRFDFEVVVFNSASVIRWNEWKLESACWPVSLKLVSDNDCWYRSARIDRGSLKTEGKKTALVFHHWMMGADCTVTVLQKRKFC